MKILNLKFLGWIFFINLKNKGEFEEYKKKE